MTERERAASILRKRERARSKRAPGAGQSLRGVTMEEKLLGRELP